MEACLPISFLNDFIFCPRSIYFHQLYGRTSQTVYHQAPQVKGLAAHKTVDQQQYTTAATVLQGIDIYSHTYNLMGKLDTFDIQKGLLSERKKKIKVIYDGYIYQLYAQYFALIDMGYKVKKIKLYSMDDNKNYPIQLPQEAPELHKAFEALLIKIRCFRLNADFKPNVNKCKHCIYNNLCDYGELL